jgi:23S rRNA pseudouridine2605 synthase
MPAERLQKILAAAGHGSRRACEDLIVAGRVRVNGQRARLGDKADPALDSITLDGEPVAAEALAYIALNKPRGVLSSLESQGDRNTVRDLVPVPGRLYPVGRLDVMSEGLMLLTNDGDLTNRLTHPRYGHDKEYRVLVSGSPDRETLQIWRRGVVLKDEAGNTERTAPAKVEVESEAGEGTWLSVVMREGKKHQIRRVGETLGLPVARIIRVRIGTLQLGKLRPGEWRHLTAAEVKALKTAKGAQREPPAGGRRRR